jgi:hypothetical protein
LCVSSCLEGVVFISSRLEEGVSLNKRLNDSSFNPEQDFNLRHDDKGTSVPDQYLPGLGLELLQQFHSRAVSENHNQVTFIKSCCDAIQEKISLADTMKLQGNTSPSDYIIEPGKGEHGEDAYLSKKDGNILWVGIGDRIKWADGHLLDRATPIYQELQELRRMGSEVNLQIEAHAF